ncbi:MAG: hypothetical protein WB660_29015 [Candidatus Sulfotelmatobacter sp.]
MLVRSGVLVEFDLLQVPLAPIVSDMAMSAALGFRLHTGWAALVALAREPDRFKILLRRRIELLPVGDSVPRFVYHEASKLTASEAVQLVHCAEDASQEATRGAVQEVLDHLRGLDFAAQAAGIPSGSRAVPKDLSTVLRSHPMIHSAEGALFQQAVIFACKICGLEVISAHEREVWRSAAAAWNLKETGLRKQIDALRQSVGAPWGTDQKTAAAFASLALWPGRRPTTWPKYSPKDGG